jgi:hypothetical protein
MQLQIGQLISFSYESARSHDRFPQVLVLHPGWRNPGGRGATLLVNALNFNYLTDDEINTVRMIIDPAFQLKYFENLAKKNANAAAEFDKIIASAGAANITSPHDFYLRAIKPFIQPRGYDPYRLYDITKMMNIRVLQTPQTMIGGNKMGVFGVKPARGGGKNEQQVLSDLALKQSQEEQTGVKQLTPTEIKFIQRLQGNAQQLFQKYKTQFKSAKGPTQNNRMPNFAGNQQQGFKEPGFYGKKSPNFMKDEDDWE